jgi:hypothetical protein
MLVIVSNILVIFILKGKSSSFEIQRGCGIVLHRTRENEKHVKPKEQYMNLTAVKNFSAMSTRQYKERSLLRIK